MRKCSKQLPKKSRGNDHLVIKSGNKVFLVLLNGLINPWKSAAGHIIRMWRQPRYQRLCIAPSKYLHLIYKLTLETSVLIFNCVNVKYTRFHVAESQTVQRNSDPRSRLFTITSVCLFQWYKYVSKSLKEN